MAETKKSTTKAKSAPKKGSKPTKSVATKSVKAPAKVAKSSAASNDTFAVIKLAGEQLKVRVGDKFEVRKVEGVKGSEMSITEVLLVATSTDVKVGNPYVSGAKVLLSIDSQKKGKKVDTFKYKAKSRYRKSYGTRPLLTRVEVKKIEA